jgi:hypothetical protein
MQRHKEKDDEAGGEGLGKLLTRKRLWRDSNGAIIADRRPEHEKKRKRPSMTSQDTSSPRQPRPVESSTPPVNDARAPLSPPTSDPTGSEANGNSGNAVSISADDQWPIPMDDAILPLEDTVMDSFDFLCNASWGNEPLQDSQDGDLPYNDMFMPDTGQLLHGYQSYAILTNSQPLLSTCLSQLQTTIIGYLETIHGQLRAMIL